MKSRFLLHTHSLDVRRPDAARPKVSPARRFELQYNASPRFARRRQQRRQGQALLLAVLIMLLAALLSAGVLAVVSGNLNQTARIADKTKAIEASRAGIAYANAQLSGSSQGDLWRPVDVSPVPLTNNAAYNFYYSQLDKVQGWASTIAPPTDPTDPNYQRDLFRFRNVTYSKFPSPNQAAGDAPKFLVKVEALPLSPNNPYYDPTYNPGHPYDADHAGEIKITSIGLSDEDPNVFSTSVAYKEGRQKSPWASALRSVSNWNFGNNNQPVGVPYAQVSAVPTVGTLPANNVDVSVNTTVDGKNAPQFSPADVPFNVVIINKNNATPTVRGAVVTKVDNTAGATKLTIAKLDSAIVAGEIIQKAAAIGVGSGIDLLNTGTPAAFATDFVQPNGILANGSVWLQNQIQLSNLSKYGTKLLASGSLAIDNADTGKKPVVQSGDVGAPTGPNSNQLVPSSQINFPGDIVLTAAAASNGVKATDLVNDGWNKIGAQTLGLDYSTSRDVEPFQPAKIDSATNLARYRALTRNSTNGVYIDNRDDVEKVGTAPMTQTQLLDMLMSPASTTPADYARKGTAAAAGTVGASLEQKHLRGWVGPDEFLARGALVEISPDPDLNGNAPSLRVTLDARSDSTAAAPNNDSGPVLEKTWRKTDGTSDAGVYTKILPWPTNGTLFAEGNLRIRGNVGTTVVAPRSLTVVSLGNIYVEGSLSVDNTTFDNTANGGTATDPSPDRKKLMLLAKKNVIVNPTRAVLARTDVQTVAKNTTAINFNGSPSAPASKPITVANAESFNIGDYVTVQGQTKTIHGVVTAKTNNAAPALNTLTIKTPDNDTVAASVNAIVRSPMEKRDAGTATTAAPATPEFFSLIDTENAVNRRVVAPITQDSTNRNKLIFDHVGELKQNGTTKAGLTIKAQDFDTTHPRPAGFTAVLTNKQPTDGTPQENLDSSVRVVTNTNKILRTYNNFAGPDTPKPFSDIPINPAPTKNISQFALEIEMTTESREMPPEGYKYTATPTDPAFGNLPSHALAGVGLRYAPGTTFTPPLNSPANNRREDFNEDTTANPQKLGFTIPLATSVEYDLKGAPANLLPTVSSSPVTKYIGFTPDPTATEDALTVDSSFYQLKTELAKSTLDSRVLSITASPDPTLTLFPQSIVLKRSTELSDAATSNLLPNYWVRSMKLENIDLNNQSIKPVMGAIQINAFVYAQEGSWLVIPGDYFRSNPPVRGIKDGNNALVGSYIDYNNDGKPDANEYVLSTPTNPSSTKVADLNRNGIADKGEKEAALRFVRYNTAPIQFYGAIVENQTAVVADVADTTAGNPPIVKGAVQDWMDKWATYTDVGAANTDVGKPQFFSFINYTYDSTLANGNVGANELSVPVTDDLIYQQ